jgi:hypothetical protein
MEKPEVAFCGLDCTHCSAYKATVGNDDELRKKTAAEWGIMFQADIKPEDIHCLGCKSATVFHYCKICEIRACNLHKLYDNCAESESYACDKLTEFLQHAPEAKANLEMIRAGK